MAAAGHVHDRELLDALEALTPEPYVGDAWRVTWATREPLTGSSVGARWNPPGGFEALYTSLTADGALAEVYHHLSRAPVFSSSHVRLARLHVETAQTLRVGWTELEALNVDEAAFRGVDYGRTQEIGAAPHLLECDGLIVPSARSAGDNLVLFLDRLDPGRLGVAELSDVNWPAWKERQEQV